MPLYRCCSCEGPRGMPGKDFEGAGPSCPDCGADPPTVIELAVIHFDPPSGIALRGANDAACNPGLRVFRSNVMMTGVPASVTCRLCRATDLWRDAMAAAGVPTVPADKDVPLTISLADAKFEPQPSE